MTLSELAEELNVSLSRLYKILQEEGKPVPGADDPVGGDLAGLLRHKVRGAPPTSEAGSPQDSGGPDAAAARQSRIGESELTWDEVIRQCRQGRRRGRGASTTIGIIGMPGCGKSAYLYVVGRRAEEIHLGPWRIGRRSDRYNEFIREKHRQLDNWQKTSPDELPAYFELFTLLRRRALRRQSVRVSSFDAAGELWRHAFIPGSAKDAGVRDYTAINRLRRMVAGCGAFLVLLDADLAVEPDVAREARRSSQPPDPEMQWRLREIEDQALEWTIFFERLDQLDSDGKGRIRRPIAVVLNKADIYALGEDHRSQALGGLSELIHLRRQGPGAVADAEYEREKAATLARRMAAAREFVQTHFPTFSRQTERMESVEYYAITCWGASPQPLPGGGVRIPRPVHPVGIDEPLARLVHRVRARAAAARRRRCALAVGIVVVVAGLLLAGAYHLSAWGAAALARGGSVEEAERLLRLAERNPYGRLAAAVGLRAITSWRAQARASVGRAYVRRARQRLSEGAVRQALEDCQRAFRAVASEGPACAGAAEAAALGAAEAHERRAAAARTAGDPNSESEHCGQALAWLDRVGRKDLRSKLLRHLATARAEQVALWLSAQRWGEARALADATVACLRRWGAPPAAVSGFATRAGEAVARFAREQAAALLKARRLADAVALTERAAALLPRLGAGGERVEGFRKAQAKALALGAPRALREVLSQRDWRQAQRLTDQALAALRRYDPSLVMGFTASAVESTRQATWDACREAWDGERWQEAKGEIDNAMDLLRAVVNVGEPAALEFREGAAGRFGAAAARAFSRHLLAGRRDQAKDAVRATWAIAEALEEAGQREPVRTAYREAFGAVLEGNAKALADVVGQEGDGALDAILWALRQVRPPQEQALRAGLADAVAGNARRGVETLLRGTTWDTAKWTAATGLADAASRKLQELGAATELREGLARALTQATTTHKSRALKSLCDRVGRLGDRAPGPGAFGKALAALADIPAPLRSAPQADEMVRRCRLGILMSWGRWLAGEGKCPEAARRFREAAKLGARDEVGIEAVRAFCEAARRAARAGAFPVAASALQYASELDGGGQAATIDQSRQAVRQLQVDDLTQRAREHLQRGLPQSALQLLERALAMETADAQAKRLKAHAELVREMKFVPFGADGFYIDETEVSRAAYREFLQAIAKQGDGRWRHPADPAKSVGERDPERWSKVLPAQWSPDADGPVIYVRWFDAYAYARFVGKRLPTAEEWQAAVGPHAYPWGSRFQRGSCNTRESGHLKARSPTAAVCGGDRSPAGVSQLAGNVSEWTSTWGADRHGCEGHVIKGSNFLCDHTLIPPAQSPHMARAGSFRAHFVGFRCACDAVPKGLVR